jgi:hypothetical protein
MNLNISAWCREQLSVWIARKPNYDEAVSEYKYVNALNKNVALFDFRDGDVALVEKFFNDADHIAGNAADPEPVILARFESYRKFFREVLIERQPRIEGLLALYVDDGPYVSESAPFFSFQKARNDSCILINDIDSLIYNFYEDVGKDDKHYNSKENSGIFVGSTTGSCHSVESISKLENQRIRSALYFKDSPLVDFSLTNIVQCLDQGAEIILREMGFGGSAVSWQDQLSRKFLLSMDGNGATCSRVALGLKSNSVLLKYNSNSMLYYFSGLQPWRHFIPIRNDEDVLDIVSAEIRQGGLFEEVASEGQKFYEECLRREPSFDYAAELLEGYYASFDRPSAPRASGTKSDPVVSECECTAFGVAHVANVGDVPTVTGCFGRLNSGQAVEGVRIFTPVHNKKKARFEYSAVYADGDEIWVRAGDLAGTTGQQRPLIGIRLRRLENIGQDFLCRIIASFTDGSQVDTGYHESVEVLQDASLESFRVYIKFIRS